MLGNFKLGKLYPKFHEKTLLMHHFLLPDLPEPPAKIYWEYKIDPSTIGMYGNDVAGCCVEAACAHHLMRVTAHAGKLVIPDPAEVMKMYSTLSGYDPATGANDNGTAITDALNYWQTVGISGHKILAWAQLDHKNMLRRDQGIYSFAGNITGVQLPRSAEDQFPNNWEVVADDGGIAGGHCIGESGKGSQGRNFDSWGKGDEKASNAWSLKYMDEAYVVICEELLEWVAASRFFNMDAMMAGLKAVAG